MSSRYLRQVQGELTRLRKAKMCQSDVLTEKSLREKKDAQGSIIRRTRMGVRNVYGGGAR